MTKTTATPLPPAGQQQFKPWYREPWPWLLMLGPFAVIVAGVITVWLAVSSSDGLVDDDYYKQGMAVNQRIHRDQEALVRGIEADLIIASGGREIVATITQTLPNATSPVLRLRLSHPTVAGRDVILSLVVGPDGAYRAPIESGLQGRWLVSLEDSSMLWRLVGEWAPEKSPALHLAPRSDRSDRNVGKLGA